jgi:hypothetical protein
MSGTPPAASHWDVVDMSLNVMTAAIAPAPPAAVIPKLLYAHESRNGLKKA